MNILEKANLLTNKDRQKSYGAPKENFGQTARIYNEITGQKIKPEDIVMMLIALKLSRHSHNKKEDNLIDLAGYAWVLNEVQK